MTRDPGKLIATMVGVGLCAAAFGAWQLPTSGSPPGLDLRLIAIPPGELTVEPTGVIATARAMQAGDPPVEGSVEVTNITGRRLLVRPVALSSVKGLAREVRMKAVACGKAIASGAPASLERPRGAGLLLSPRQSCPIEMTAWMEPGVVGYRGRILDISLEFRTRSLGAGG